MGGYGFIRFSLPMFPDASVYFTPLVYALSVIAIIYTSLVALAQENMKKLIAYSSVAHMGFVTMGIFAANTQGVQGAVYQMISHGLVSGALFLCVGVVYDRTHSLEIADYGGLVQRMPLYALAFMLFTLANVGLPGTSGFIGEFLTLIGTFQANNLGRLLCELRPDSFGGLRALSLPAHYLRRDRESQPDDHRRPRAARNRDAAAARTAGALLRRAPSADHRRERGLDRLAAQRLRAGHHRNQDRGAVMGRMRAATFENE